MDPKDIPIRDLHLPPEISWWPLAPGWWVLLAVAFLSLLLLGWAAYKRFVANSARRYALRELERLSRDYQHHQNVQELGAGLSELLRRAALAYADRADVAGLTGEQWANYLDQGLGSPTFSEGAGQQLLELPYRRPDSLRDVDVAALIDAVRMRLKTPMEATR